MGFNSEIKLMFDIPHAIYDGRLLCVTQRRENTLITLCFYAQAFPQFIYGEFLLDGFTSKKKSKQSHSGTVLTFFGKDATVFVQKSIQRDSINECYFF